MTPPPDKPRCAGPPSVCGECGTPFGADQRYCLRCGARRGELPAAIGAMLAAGLEPASASPSPPPPVEPGPEAAPAEEAAAATGAAAAGAAGTSAGFLPSPRAAAIAVLGMLGLGVLLGSATSQLARSAGIAPIIVLSSPAPEEEAEEETGYEPPEEEAAPAETAAVPFVPEEALPEYEPAPEPAPTPEPPPDVFEEEETETLPEIDHVFVIMLGDNSFEETFGKESTAPYLAKTLPEEGELLTNYYGVTSGSLANQIALISGQGPTPETALDCPTYADLLPGTISAEGQAEGSGCVYPAKAETLISQLGAAKKTWKAYVEDMGKGAASGQPTSCRHPQLGSPDPSQAPLPGDPYVTWRNPFVYFRAITDSSECAENDVDLEQLGADLKTAKKTPTLAYIVPNACHAGGEASCEEAQPSEEAQPTEEAQPSAGTDSYTEPQPTPEPQPSAEAQPSGAVAAEEFLEEVVPEITESPAYEEGHSLIAITSAQAPQSGEHADSSSCCATPEYPNLPPPAEAEVVPGKVKPSGGGGRVGLLLISPFVEPGSVEESGYYNHFTLLATLEELFGLTTIGYASEQLAFDSTVFNAGGEEESTAAARPLGRTLSRAVSAVRSAVPVPGRRR